MKRQLTLLASLVLVVAMLFALASCDLFKKPEHTHNFVDGKCECGEADPNYVAHTHNFVEGKCECGEEDPNYTPAECEHSYSISETKATCTVDGSKTFTCTECGYSYSTTVAATGHLNLETLPGKAPTCADAGLSEGKKCLDCGETIVAQNSINATGAHTYVEGECSGCGLVDPDYNGPKTHRFDTNTVVLNNEDGTQNLTDKAEVPAGTTYVDDYFTIVGIVTQRVKNGEYVYCVEVGKQLKGGIQFTVTGTATVSINFHSTSGSNTSWIGLVDAENNLIDNNEGVNTVTGTGEGLTVTYNLTAGTYTVCSPALTDENGEDPYNRTARVYSISVTETPATEPEVIGGTINTATTDTYITNYDLDFFTFKATAGEGYYTFNVPAGLGALIDGENFPVIDFYDNANGYTFTRGLEDGQEITIWVSATTIADWQVTWTYEAGEVEAGGEPAGCDHWWMPAMGHPDMVLPTCQNGGVIVQECWNCGEFMFEEVGPDLDNGHDYVTNMETFKEATCKADGFKEETCSLCGNHVETVLSKDFADHDYIYDEATYKEANCKDAGYAKYTCTVCGDTYEENTPADPVWGHNYEYSNNYSIATCSVCNKVIFEFNVNETETTYGLSLGMSYMTGNSVLSVWNADYSINEAFGFTYTYADGVYTLTLTNDYENANASGLMNATITIKAVCAGLEVTVTPAEGSAVVYKNYESAHLDENYDGKCDVCANYFLPEVGVAFQLKMYQANLGKVLYFAGSGTDFLNTGAYSASVNLYLEAADGGHRIYFMNGEVKTYVNIYTNSSSKVRLQLATDEATATVWAFDAKYGMFTTAHTDGNTYYIGSYNSFDTLSVSKTSFVNDSNVDKSQFIARPVVIPEHECEFSEATCTVLATCPYCGTTTGDLKEHAYDEGVATAPNCTDAGYTTYTCVDCGHTNKVTGDAALGHTTENGTCERCNEVIGDAPVATPTVIDRNTIFAGLTGTSYATYNGAHTLGDLTVTTADVLANEHGVKDVLQFKKSSGKITVSSTTVSSITFVVVSSYDYTAHLKITVGGTAITLPATSEVNAAGVKTGLKNSNGYEVSRYTVTVTLDQPLTGEIVISNGNTYAVYVENFTITH